MRRFHLGAALVAGALLCPMGAASAPSSDDSEAVRAAVRAFKSAGESQDVAALQPLLHDGFRVLFAWTHEAGVTVLDRSGYLGLLEGGKIGGQEGVITFGKVVVRDEIAQADATITRPDARFQSSFTLVRSGEGWQIAQDAVVVEAKPKK